MLDLPTKAKLLEAIQPGIKVTEAFLLQIYGYSVSDPYIAGIALDQLEFAGIKGAKEMYKKVVYQWQAEHEEMLDRAAAEYRRKVEEEQRTEVKLWQKKVEELTENEAKKILKELLHL